VVNDEPEQIIAARFPVSNAVLEMEGSDKPERRLLRWLSLRVMRHAVRPRGDPSEGQPPGWARKSMSLS